MLYIYSGLLFIALCIEWLLLLWTLFLNDAFVISCDPNIKKKIITQERYPFLLTLTFVINVFDQHLSVQYELFSAYVWNVL
jgi:hypothetical protein